MLHLKTFQPASRVAHLRGDGRLVGDWAHTLGGVERPYQSMVQAMEAQGIDCQRRPPIWAWWGRVTLGDAAMLLNEEHELSLGYVTITFDAPSELVLLSDYGDFCEALFDNQTWTPSTPAPSTAPQDALAAVQAALPYLLESWVTSIEPLPTTIPEEAWETPV